MFKSLIRALVTPKNISDAIHLMHEIKDKEKYSQNKWLYSQKYRVLRSKEESFQIFLTKVL
jgi:hypothetical protein